MRQLVGYFLRLGTLGFGGPIALAGHMHRDLVEGRRWISQQDYQEGLALAQLAPGPLAAQLAIYLGWVRGGVLGATLVGVAFILPSFLMVLALAALYVAYGGLPWMQGVFYGVNAAVIAIIARSAYKLVRSGLGQDRWLWAVFGVNALATAWTQSEVIWLVLLSGILILLIKVPPKASQLASIAGPGAVWWLTGVSGPAEPTTLGRIGLYFAEAGAFVFGSGLAIVPFLYGGVVQEYHWLNERQFLDAVAVAMITPGPVVITVAFIGYLVAGPLGGLVAAFGVFLPCYLLVVLPAPYYRRFAKNERIKAFVAGVTAAATGAIAGAAFVLGTRAITDLATAGIALVALALLVLVRRLPEPAIVLAAGLAGLWLLG
jgi:chromate transporter